MNTLITDYFQPDTIKMPTTSFYEDEYGYQMCKCSCGRIWDGCSQCPCALDQY